LITFHSLEQQEQDVKNRNVAGFYREILNTRERQTIVLGDASMSVVLLTSKREAEDEKTQKLTKAGVVLNDSAEIVDKRQLLVGGLNVSARSLKRKQEEREEIREIDQKERDRLRKEEQDRRRRDREAEEQARRQTKVALEQKARMQQEKESMKESQEKKVLEVLTASTLDEKKVLSARERYLARKNANR
jgi:coiled-coil domain-containing protein 55